MLTEIPKPTIKLESRLKMMMKELARTVHIAMGKSEIDVEMAINIAVEARQIHVRNGNQRGIIR